MRDALAAGGTRDTIVAIATPPGRGGLGVIRLSGPLARGIAEPLLRSRRPLSAGRARYAELLDPGSVGAGKTPVVLDEAVVTYFAAPHSYTAEDVVEMSLHGAPVLLEAVLGYATTHGARLAEPGEFTQRAFLSGRLDLTRAEAVRDLIDASTLHQARVAAAQLGGSVSRAIAPAKRQLVRLIAALEAGIDFAEDDLEGMGEAEMAGQLAEILAPLDGLVASFAFGRVTREGFQVALVGEPNAGKSSLFNALLGRDRSIVTAQPGTTRDVVQEQLQIEGIPVALMDTAGLRELEAESVHEAERAGMARTRSTMAEVHHVLVVVDGTIDSGAPGVLAERPHTVVVNKVDLLDAAKRAALADRFPGAVLVSALRGEGMEELRGALGVVLGKGGAQAESTLVTNLRQQRAIESACMQLRAARAAAGAGTPQEMVLLDVYGALGSLDEVTGETGVDAILGEIFSTFCIGK